MSSMDPLMQDKPCAILRKRDTALLRWLQLTKVCRGNRQSLGDDVRLEVTSAGDAQDRVRKVPLATLNPCTQCHVIKRIHDNLASGWCEGTSVP